MPHQSEDRKSEGSFSPNQTGSAVGSLTPEQITEMGQRLLAEIQALQSGDPDSAETRQKLRVVRALLERIQVFGWRRVASGDLDAPRKVLDIFLGLQSFVDAHLPRLNALASGALALKATLDGLMIADEALAELRTRARLADQERSPREQAIIAILASNQGVPLRRGQIYNYLNPETRPTLARVGQILAELHLEGILRRILAPAQGNPETGFYELSGQGKRVWEEIRRRHREASPSSWPFSQPEDIFADVARSRETSAPQVDRSRSLGDR